MTKEFCQSEILSHLAQYTYNPTSGRAAERYHGYVIIASQDCDIAQDYKNIVAKTESSMNGLLLYETFLALEVRDKIKSNDQWNRIVQNRDDRYHYLEECPSELDLTGAGVPALIVDFKRYFTIDPSEAYRQCTLAHGALRRCRLETPYREHFQNRAAFYLQRVMLPLPHKKPALKPQTGS